EGTPSTLEADAFQYLGNIAEKMIRAGRAATAERLLRGHLEEVLSAVRASETVGRDVIDAASVNAMRLAVGLGHVVGVDFVIELHSAVGMPPCSAVIAALRSIVRKLPGVDQERWRAYEKTLTTGMPAFTAPDQALARAFLWLDKPQG